MRSIFRYRASFFVYLWIGGLSALVNWAVFYCFSVSLHWHYVLSAVVAFVAATAVNFLLSERIGFLSGSRSRIWRFFGVYLVSAAALVVDLMVLAVLYEILGVDVMVSKIAGTAAAFVVNFVGRQFVVFVRQPRWTALSDLPREFSSMLSRQKPRSSPHRHRS